MVIVYNTLDCGELLTTMIVMLVSMHIPYPRERGPMGGAPYIGPRRGGGPIFEVSVAHLDMKEHPGKLPTLSS